MTVPVATARMSQVIVAKAFTELPPQVDKRTVIGLVAGGLVKAKLIPAQNLDGIVEEAMKREVIGSTGIGHGIGIPHCRTPLVKEIICAYGHSAEGIDFDSLDGEPVHSVFLLLTPPDQREQHLHLMRSFASQIRKEHFCEFLHEVKTHQGLIDLLAEFEGR